MAGMKRRTVHPKPADEGNFPSCGRASSRAVLPPRREHLFICFERVTGYPMRAAPGTLKSVPRPACVFGHHLKPENIVRWEGPADARVAICGVCDAAIRYALDQGTTFPEGLRATGARSTYAFPVPAGAPAQPTLNLAALDHCRWGHPRTPENTSVNARGITICLPCNRAYGHANYHSTTFEEGLRAEVQRSHLRAMADDALWPYGKVLSTPNQLRKRHGYEVDGNGCWVYQGKTRRGYGLVGTSASSSESAHRVFWRRWIGPIPGSRELDHLCRVPACINPQHLRPATRSENMKAAWLYRRTGS